VFQKEMGGSGSGKLDLCSETPFILMRSNEGDDAMTNSVPTKVFCAHIGSMFGEIFDFFCTHRIGVGSLFEAVSVCIRIGVHSR